MCFYVSEHEYAQKYCDKQVHTRTQREIDAIRSYPVNKFTYEMKLLTYFVKPKYVYALFNIITRFFNENGCKSAGT